MKQKQQIKSPLLLRSPLCFIDVGVEMVVPSLTTLLSDSVWNELSDVSPLFGSMLTDNFDKHFILSFTPLSFPEH
jgi:hypothetical protein